MKVVILLGGVARRGSWTIALLLLPLLASPAAAEGPFQEGAHDIPDTLVVGPDDTFVLGPGTSLAGRGSLEVHGRLEARGEPGWPVQVAIPIRLLSDKAHVVSHARLWGVNGTAVHVENGTLRLDDVLFEAGGTGLDLAGAAVAQGANVTFRAHADAGLSVGPQARADLSNVRFEDNGVGARVLPGGTLRLEAVRAAGNRLHLDAQVAPPAADGPRVLLLGADVGATGPGGTMGIRLRAAPGAVPSSAPGFMLFGGRVHDAAVGLQATGPDLRVRVEGAAIEGNGVGLSLSQAAVELKDVRLGNARDVEGGETSQVVLENVTRLPGPEAAPAGAASTGAAPWPAWVPWVAMASVLVVAGAILWTARAPRPAPLVVPAPAVTPLPPVEDAPDPGDAQEAPAPSPPPLAAAASGLGMQERRILADIVANPDTAQAAVGERLGLSRQAVHYHVKKLEAKGLIRKTTKGRETQCRAVEGAASVLAEPPAASET